MLHNQHLSNCPSVPGNIAQEAETCLALIKPYGSPAPRKTDHGATYLQSHPGSWVRRIILITAQGHPHYRASLRWYMNFYLKRPKLPKFCFFEAVSFVISQSTQFTKKSEAIKNSTYQAQHKAGIAAPSWRSPPTRPTVIYIDFTIVGLKIYFTVYVRALCAHRSQ